MNTPLPISATLLCKNSEKYLAQVLNSLRDFDEILLLDNGSTDNSLSIAAQYPNCRIISHEFIGFGAMKNLAADYARNDWIFNIDSDEIPDEELRLALKQMDLSNPQQVFNLSRLNHYRGRAIKGCGLRYPDILPRIYHKQHCRFSDRRVHERLEYPSHFSSPVLSGYLKHYSFDNAAALIEKMQFYTTLFAEEQRLKKSASITKANLHALAAFIKSYLLKRGFLYGADGYLISSANAMGAYFKYAKLAEANQNLSISLIITTYNRPDALQRVLESAAQQSILPQEILVTDSGSGAETAAVIAAFAAQSPIPIRHIWQEDKGFRAAESRNRAIAAANNEYLVMIDGDLILHPEFIRDHKQAAKQGRFIQGSRVLLSPERTTALLSQSIQAPFKLAFYAQGIEKRQAAIRLPLLSAWVLKQENQAAKGIKSCNMGFFRADAIAVNGFNQDFIGWGHEDSEFAARLYHYGLKRRNLRFAGIAYHLWHQEANRAALPENDAILAKTLTEKIIRCRNGISQLMY